MHWLPGLKANQILLFQGEGGRVSRCLALIFRETREETEQTCANMHVFTHFLPLPSPLLFNCLGNVFLQNALHCHVIALKRD